MKQRTGLLVWQMGLLCLIAFPASVVSAADESPLRAFLARTVVSPDLVMMEVEHFCDSRVPRMPGFASVEDWEPFAERLRRDVLERVVLRGEAAAWRDAPTRVEWLGTIDGGAGYTLKRLRYEALPDLWIPAVLYEPAGLSHPVPVAMNVNGHDGQGKAARYKQIRCVNQAKRGILALNVEWLGMGQLSTANLQHYRMNQLDLCGTSGLAPFYLSLKRGLDVLLTHPFADPKRVAVAGLSGGGWQTIFISSLDTRVTLSNPVAGYSSYITRAHYYSDLGDSEQTPCDLATIADYTHLTALRAPRATLLTYNKKDDCCFASDHALPPLLEAATPIFKLYGQEERLRSHVNEDPGTHNFELDNRKAHYRMLADHFFAGDASFPLEEIDCQNEIRTTDELRVELPAENSDFNKLAMQLCRELPRDGQLPTAGQDVELWRQARVKLLGEVVRATSYGVQAEQLASETSEGIQATFWKLRLGDTWTLPAVELSTERSRDTAVVVADDGYQSAAGQIERLLADDYRVLAMDPFFVGGSRIPNRDFLFALLVAAVGSRPLGLQASQLAAVARWLENDRGLGPVAVVASGEQLGLSALVAAALEQHAIGRVELTGSLGSLKEVIERSESVDKKPILFCFGLLEHFDIRQLIAVTAPREVRLRDASQRARDELKDLKEWYRSLGKEWSCLPP